MKVKVLIVQSCSTLCNPMDCTCQALLSMEFCRQEYWSRFLFSPSGDLPDPGIKPRSSALQADSLPFEPPGKLSKKYVETKINLSLPIWQASLR